MILTNFKIKLIATKFSQVAPNSGPGTDANNYILKPIIMFPENPRNMYHVYCVMG